MKVLKDNYNQIKEDNKHNFNKIIPYPRKLVCENCQSELEYEEADLRMGEYGCMFLDCPCCGSNNMLGDNEHNITLTIDNIEFPTHFHHTSTNTGAVECFDNENIKQCIEKGINYLRKHKDASDWFTQFGNLYVQIYKFSGDEIYEINACNNYYTAEIPFEAQDYDR